MSPAGSSRAPRLGDPRQIVRRDTVLIVAVHITAEPAAPFRSGPLVRRWRVGRPDEVESTASRRTAYTDPRLSPLLWDPPVRWHREVAAVSPPSPARFQLSAIELVRLNASALATLRDMNSPAAANGVALFHGDLPPDAPERLAKSLQECADVDPHHALGAQRAWLGMLLPEGCRISPTEREAVHCTLVTARSRLPRLQRSRAYRDWDAVDQWLWQMHYATLYPPSPDSLSQLHSMRLPLPTKVRGIVSSRGLTLVGTEPDAGHGVAQNYFDGTSYHLATLYVDALALAKLHRIVLEAFGTEVARIGEREPRRREVARLERDLLVFRRGYWSAGFGRQGAVDAIIHAWQIHAGLPEAQQSLVDDLRELSAQVQAAETETTNAILGLLAAVGLPLSVGLAVWQGLPQSGSTLLWRTLVFTGGATSALIVSFPGLRRLFVDLFRRRRR